jgi:uncharacterized membrane protein HdeD (DUF308 family)
LPLLAGFVGVFAGVAMLGRSVTRAYIAEEIMLAVLGIMIILTGFLHIFGGFRKEFGERRQWSWTSFFLGLFEIILGVLFIVEPLEQGTFIYIAASVWALIGGLILVSDALRIRRKGNVSRTKESINIDSDTTGGG